MLIEPVVPVVSVAGGSVTQKVRGFLVQAGVLSPNLPYMTWADLKAFVPERIFG